MASGEMTTDARLYPSRRGLIRGLATGFGLSVVVGIAVISILLSSESLPDPAWQAVVGVLTVLVVGFVIVVYRNALRTHDGPLAGGFTVGFLIGGVAVIALVAGAGASLAGN